MAKKYGFKYELVQYKWPRWLYQQIEKQRIIWGYKILFLDVLFPLAVDKIIFVDADQVRKNNFVSMYEEFILAYINPVSFPVANLFKYWFHKTIAIVQAEPVVLQNMKCNNFTCP